MSKLKEKIHEVYDMITSDMDELVQNAWWDMQDLIEAKKDDLREDLQDVARQIAEDHGFDVEDVMEIMDEDIEDIIDETIYAEWDV